MSSTTPSATPVKKDKDTATSPGPPSIVTNTSRIPSTSFTAATSLSSSFEPLSSDEILERVPSPVVRLAAALGPAIHAFHRFIRLATWTGGKGSTSSSMLLLVSFWLTCAFGYEVLRYAPQLVVLAWIGYAGIRRQLAFARPRTHSPAKLIEKHDVVSAASLNATLLELSELADFFSSLRKNVLVPAVQLVSWDPSPMSTKAVAVFLILTWPLWLLVFLPLRETGFPSLVLPVSGAGIVASVASWNAFVYHQILKLIGPEHVATAHGKVAPLYAHYDNLSALVAKTPLPLIYAHLANLASRVRWEQWTEFNLTLLPPYPIGALTVRSLVCFVGTLALTWCSPWCSLFRQAVWKSATVRRVVRGTGRLLSGQTSARDAYGKGNLDDEWAHGLYHEDGSELVPGGKGKIGTSASTASASTAAAENTSKTAGAAEDKVVRHDDVVYQFSIFENQRWWVGLDWTAALLPQERPSWSDESNNPVSPPSSFSLPATKIMLTPSPTASDPKAFTRRTIKWQWVDPEWSIAGVSSRGGYYPSSVYKGSAKDAAIKSAGVVGDKDALASAKQGYLGDALNRIRAKTDVGTAVKVEEGAEEEEWDVDAEGWQYGDNAWEKMSKKSGMGRYTRRRKWVRRARLSEVVEYGVHGPTASSPVSSPGAAEKKDAEVSTAAKPEREESGGVKKAEVEHDSKVDGVDSAIEPKIDTDVEAASTTDPTPSAEALAAKRPSISDRLAKAAH